MKVLLVGSYHGNNKGDEAIFFAFQQRIKEISNTTDITITTKNELYFQTNYKVKTVTPFRALLNVRKFDVVILGGGGLLFDYSIFDTLRVTKQSQLLYWLLVTYLANFFKKKILWISLGIGPLTTSLAKTLTKFVALRVNYITVRDNQSFKILSDMGIKRVAETRDIVFGLSINTLVTSPTPDKYVLVIPRYWKEEKDKIYENFCKIIEQFLSNGDAVVLSETNNNKDKVLTERLSSHFQGRNNFQYLPLIPNKSLSNFFDLIRGSKLIISMRMHPIIIAALFRIPSIAVEYNTLKIKEVMDELSMGGQVFQLDGISNYAINKGKFNDNVLMEIKNAEKINTEILKEYLYD